VDPFKKMATMLKPSVTVTVTDTSVQIACDRKYFPLKLWEDDYETIARKLVHDYGFKGDKALKAIMGTWIWEAHTKNFRRTFLKRLRDLGVMFDVVKVKGNSRILVIGTDRVRLTKGIKDAAKKRIITPQQRGDYILRVARGTFPNPDDDFEVGLEMDLLLSE
jgi:hypothetical protein